MVKKEKTISCLPFLTRQILFFVVTENTIPYRAHLDPHASKLKGCDLQVYFVPGNGVVEAVSLGGLHSLLKSDRSKGPQSQAVWGIVEEASLFRWRREIFNHWEGGWDFCYILLEVRTRMKGPNIVKQRTNIWDLRRWRRKGVKVANIYLAPTVFPPK